MILKYLSLFFVSAFLLSCSMDRGPFGWGGEPSHNKITMSEARGINPQLMDKKLQNFIAETESIELKVATLLKRLNYLRDEISAYDQTRIEKINDVVQVSAEKQPQVILPVPEREMAKAKPAQKKAKIKPSSQKITAVAPSMFIAMSAPRDRPMARWIASPISAN